MSSAPRSLYQDAGHSGRQKLISDSSNWKSNPFEICVHFGLPRFITPIVESLDNGEEASFAHNCHMCNTDSQIEIREFDSKIASIMTSWINLGSGLTREDLLWKTHVSLPDGPRGRLDGDDPEHLLTAQSPRLCFEDLAPQSFEDLRSRNLSYLRNQQYKNVMPFIAAGLNLWRISYREPSKKGTIKSLWSLLGRSAISLESGTVAERTRRISLSHDPPSPSNRLSFDDMGLLPVWMWMP